MDVVLASSELSPIAERLLREEILILLVIGSVITAIVALRTVAGTVKAVARERTRREIAAYIAEGAMTPEHGERLLKAQDRTVV